MTLTATASKLVFNVTIHWGIFSLAWMETSPDTMSSTYWNLWYRLNHLTIILPVSLKKFSWRHTARGMCFKIKRLISSELGLSSQQFHWKTGLVIRRKYGSYFRLCWCQPNQPKFGHCCLSKNFVQLFSFVLNRHLFSYVLDRLRETCARLAWWIFLNDTHTHTHTHTHKSKCVSSIDSNTFRMAVEQLQIRMTCLLRCRYLYCCNTLRR